MENRLRILRKRAGLSLEQLAERLGVSQSQVSRWERGLSPLPAQRLMAIGEALGVAAHTLFVWDDDPFDPPDGVGQLEPLPPRPEGNGKPVPFEGASVERMREDLPVFGTALGAPRDFDGEAIEQTTLNQGEVVYYAKRPVALNDRPDAYGLHVQGSSMDPVHLEGDLVIVERKRPARIGDDVVVYMRDMAEDDGERARAVLIKRLVKRTASYIELQQFNPPHTFKVETPDFTRFDRVMRLADFLS